MMRRLVEETHHYLAGTSMEPAINHPPYAFNLFSHNTAINEHGQNEEEAKVVAESRKILDRPDLRVNVTCVRVPVLRAHSESVTVEYAGEAPSEERHPRCAEGNAWRAGASTDRTANNFPTSARRQRPARMTSSWAGSQAGRVAPLGNLDVRRRTTSC